ncbi:hypothetical protein NECID01_1582 [Nematocida sp. AWRm77]|nr:hypothetical protein NECID01_1582 [Nematocida sp. AWRm77]
MTNNELLESLDSKKGNEPVDFEKECKEVLGAERISPNRVYSLMQMLDRTCTSEINRENHTILLSSKKLAYRDSGTEKKKNVFSELLWEYVSRYQKLCKVYYPCIASILTYYMHEEAKEASDDSQVFHEKKELFLSRALSILHNRSSEEKHMGFIPPPVIGILEELIQNNKEILEEIAVEALHKLREMSKQVQDFCLVGQGLLPMFKHFSVMVETAAKHSTQNVISLFSILQLMLKNSTSFAISRNIYSLAFLLCREIQKKTLAMLGGLQVYVDPASPVLSGCLQIKTRDCSTVVSSELIISDKHVASFVVEIAAYMFHPYMHITSVEIEIREKIVAVDPKVWNLFHQLFCTEISKCKIKLMTVDSSSCSSLIEGFFSSTISRHIVQMEISPFLILSEKSLQLISKCTLLNHLSLGEPFSTEEEGSLAIESFLLWMKNNKKQFILNLRFLRLSFVYSKKTFSVLSKISFANTRILEIDFLSGSLYADKPPFMPALSVLVNKTAFPRLEEVSIHNSAVSLEDFTKFSTEMSLVQNRYKMLFCPMGSSYLPFQTHSTFKKPEPVPLNTGLVFMINESTAYKWSVLASYSILDECVLCKKTYSPDGTSDVLIMPCGNLFHMECVLHLVSQRKNMCCPLCKKKIHMYKGLAVAIDVLFCTRDRSQVYSSLSESTKQEDLFDFFFAHD